jgi:tetratricopeptide (TPR) repeat protein
MSVAVLGAVGVSPGAVSPEAKYTNGAKFAKPLKEAHDDLKAKRYADAISKLRAAENIEGKTPYDQHLINDFLTFAYVNTQDYAEAAKTLETEVDDGFFAQSEIPAKVRMLAEVHYQIKNYDKAIEYGQRGIKGGFGDDELTRLVGQAYYLKGDWNGTLKFEGELVSGDIKRCETPKKESLQLIYSACLKLQDEACATHALQWLDQYYGHSPVGPADQLPCTAVERPGRLARVTHHTPISESA